MTIQELLAIPAEERKAKIMGLSAQEQQTLFQAVQQDSDAREKEFISNQSLLKKAKEDYESELAKLKEIGINSEEELTQEIQRLDDELTTKVVEYSIAIDPNTPSVNESAGV